MFTDDDLKRLKVKIEGKSPLDNGIVSTGLIIGILARLEFAERHIRKCVEFHGTDDNDRKELEDWERSCGL